MAIKEKPAPKWRHELKHRINAADDLILAARLRKLFPHDKHAGSHGSYRVSSLYFDTPYDKALREKLDSVGRREKFRLRYYNGDTSFVLLEKKFKQNGLCGKHKAVLSEDEARQLLAGRDDFLLARPEALCAELSASCGDSFCSQRPSSSTSARRFSIRLAMCASPSTGSCAADWRASIFSIQSGRIRWSTTVSPCSR